MKIFAIKAKLAKLAWGIIRGVENMTNHIFE